MRLLRGRAVRAAAGSRHGSPGSFANRYGPLHGPTQRCAERPAGRRTRPVGRLFAVVSQGYGSMPSYADQIPPRDRWAIVAYLRTLQLSQHFPVEKLSADGREKLAGAPPAEGGGP